MSRPPCPPFNAETATQKVRLAEDVWNSRDPAQVVLAYSQDTYWRNRTEFLQGRDAIVDFLTRKWVRELDYRLIEEVFAFNDNHIAVRLPMSGIGVAATATRIESSTQSASISDLPIAEGERKYHWPLGRRPDGHAGLSDLGL